MITPERLSELSKLLSEIAEAGKGLEWCDVSVGVWEHNTTVMFAKDGVLLYLTPDSWDIDVIFGSGSEEGSMPTPILRDLLQRVSLK